MEARGALLSRRFVLVTGLGTLYFLSLGMLAEVVPQFVKHSLHGNNVEVGIAVGAFAVGAVLLRPYAGRIGDRIGRRILIVGGAATVAASMGVYLAASTLTVLIIGRVLGGIGEAAFFVGAGTMITDLAPIDRRGEAISYWSVAVYSGLAFGPVLGQTVLDAWGYTAVWWGAAAAAAGASLLGLLTRETLPPGVGPHDVPLLHRRAIAPGVILFLGLRGLAGFTEFLPLYVTDIGLGSAETVFLLYGCLILVVRIFGARLPDRLGPLRAGTLALGTGAIGLLLMAAWPSVVGLVAGTAVFAMGMSLMYPSLLTLASSGVADSERGAVVGTVSSFFDLSQGLGALLAGGMAEVAGYRGAFAGTAVLGIIGLGVLRSGVDPRVRNPVVQVHAFDEIPEPEPGT